jgi:DNA/RNA-binding domain of Phe-tRNA-synthetase-like protein
MTVSVAPYPGLAVRLLAARFARPLGETPAPAAALGALRLDAEAPLAPTDAVRAAVRDLLRARGYKPTGRGKPASEYLLRAAEAGTLGPINAAVDVCNAVSLHSGLPISVVDLPRARAPFRIDTAAPDDAYVFNAGGQTIALGGLLCLFDAEGPCANAVRDSQRTKTHDGTTATLSVLWAPEALADRLDAAAAWYEALLADAGATVEPVATAHTSSP